MNEKSPGTRTKIGEIVLGRIRKIQRQSGDSLTPFYGQGGCFFIRTSQ